MSVQNERVAAKENTQAPGVWTTGGVGGQVRYCALSDDVTPESGGDPELARSARKAMLRSPCPNQHMSTAMAAGATEDVLVWLQRHPFESSAPSLDLILKVERAGSAEPRVE